MCEEQTNLQYPPSKHSLSTSIHKTHSRRQSALVMMVVCLSSHPPYRITHNDQYFPMTWPGLIPLHLCFYITLKNASGPFLKQHLSKIIRSWGDYNFHLIYLFILYSERSIFRVSTRKSLNDFPSRRRKKKVVWGKSTLLAIHPLFSRATSDDRMFTQNIFPSDVLWLTLLRNDDSDDFLGAKICCLSLTDAFVHHHYWRKRYRRIWLMVFGW